MQFTRIREGSSRISLKGQKWNSMRWFLFVSAFVLVVWFAWGSVKDLRLDSKKKMKYGGKLNMGKRDLDIKKKKKKE